MTKSKYRNIRFFFSILGTVGILGILWLVIPNILNDYPNWLSIGISVCTILLPATFDVFMKWKDPDMVLRIFPNEHDERALQLKYKAAYKLIQFLCVFGVSYFFILGLNRSNDELFYFLAYSLIGGIIVYSIILQYYKKTE